MPTSFTLALATLTQEERGKGEGGAVDRGSILSLASLARFLFELRMGGR